MPQASWVTKPYDPNETVKIAGFGTSTPTPKYNPYDYPTELPLFNNPLHKGKGSSSAGNSGDDNHQNNDNNPPVLGYYYDDDDEPLKLGYYDDDPIWESENNLIIYPSDNHCYGDCVIRLNDPTQQYGGQVIPVYQPSDKNFGILTRALNSNNPAAVETALLILVGSSVVTQQTADAIQSAANRGDFDGAKNILAQSQATGGAMPPDDGDGKNNSKRDKETEKKIDNILKDTKKGEKTSGKARQYEKSGDFETAKQDFYSLNPKNVKSRGENKITGELPDGRQVNVRIESSDNRPTLEIQNTRNNFTKIRYGSK